MSLFISYSSKDELFANRLYTDLKLKGIPCWLAPHDMPIGAKILDSIDDAIRQQEKFLLILSKNFISSDWVEDEVSKAFAEERRRGQNVLFPVRIDDSIMKTTEAWAVKIKDQRNIGDFRNWTDETAYKYELDKILRDLTRT
jgi:TIR domain